MDCPGITVKGVCIPLYYDLSIRWRDPRSDLFQSFDDIRILATINEGIRHISGEEIRARLTKAVRAAAEEVPMPDGVQLGGGLFGARRTTEA
jgi:hypothetical protein